MGDRLLYTPVLGIIIAVVFMLFYFSNNSEVEKFYHPSIYFLSFIALFFSFNTFIEIKFGNRMTLCLMRIYLMLQIVHVLILIMQLYFLINYHLIPNSKKKQLPFVIDEYKKVLSIDNNDKGTLINLGVCYYKLKDYKMSIYYTKRAFMIEQE